MLDRFSLNSACEERGWHRYAHYVYTEDAFMKYSVLADDKPVPDLTFLRELADAKLGGEKIAAENIAVEVQIEGYPEQPGMMLTWRFDREVTAWVETR
ncbi:hypothetical protein NKJ90_05415 [Mesorhizobium sp. M0051]|uniref:hypothetical protein n=1 Tax=unclassified Mesorhizobium TaxID=325217 RepID=UPI0003CE1150|nr:hypothetical protein [Mesorhizobium sp. LNHC252B00]ESY65540.1 hypothetical protein X743_29430 [Mesorhizobium sp. LNHC252B00]